jgi:chromate transporter
MFAIGGAYSFLPLIEREVVEKYQWLSRTEFLDVLGIVKIFPGAISIKYATYTGYKVAGIPGAVVANLGNLLAPVIIIIFASILYAKYKNLPAVKGAFNMIQLVVFAMIIAVAFQLLNVGQLFQLKSLLVIVVAFALFFLTKVHPALIIIGAGILGAFLR